MTLKTTSIGDISDFNGDNWFYSDQVKEHFFNPKNLLLEDPTRAQKYNASGMVGAPACGDMMKIWLKVDPKSERIKKCKWRTFGCASAIASTSAMSEIVTTGGGMTLAKARQLQPGDIMTHLGGLPLRKIHCSVLGDKALRTAINNYYYRTGQFNKVEKESSRIIDRNLNITEADVEEVIARGARSMSQVRQQLKVGAGMDKASKEELRQLVNYYIEQYEYDPRPRNIKIKQGRGNG
jgi:NifU-like protein involved in Fe-S cluster formation